ncbi:hypothetical protein CfE428DRAFT_1282 [Chthoniobacter flavus Ellin428]|uniref:Uncharacterized protein n=2 Tax=Chthoniobacter flavus TaxID=191863 RepID=B4CXJ1_9BACT|nr:hypothetical protein CfE428DRAFT_1282 [Chthoniobacter flavus Ellin428]TCO88716.1 hypothetical protein EV701_11688 [Chthoniobacter flavus]
MKEAKPAINRYLFDRTVVIAAHNEQTPYDHGTGMLVRANDTPLIVTAAHVIERHDVERLQIVAQEKPSNLRAAPEEKDFMSGVSDDDLDVGYLRPSEWCLRQLAHKSWLTLDDFELFPEGLAEDLTMTFGMPEAAHKTEHGIIHLYDSFLYQTNVPEDFDWGKPGSRPLNMRMEYPERVLDVFTGEWQDLPEPYGMSGGGIWRARFKDSLFWIPARMRLIGINSMFFEEDREIQANRIEALIHLLAKDFPEADAYLDRETEALERRRS